MGLNLDFVCLDTKCFERSLAKRRDSALFVYGQYCRYVRKLCHRAILPKYIPGDVEWTKLLQLCPDDLRQLSCRDFLNRLKFTVDLDAACQAKVIRSPSDKAPTASLEEMVAKEKEKFGTEARGYIVSLLETLLEDIHFTADIVHGMGCFDPHVLLSLPLEQATFCFNALFDSFHLRGWVDLADKSDYQEEYFEFIDLFRNTCDTVKNAPNTIVDMLDFLIALPSFRSRSRLFHLFRLCCLCITEAHQELPTIKFHDVDTSSSSCRLSAVILPAQSYLSNCPEAIANCTTESALAQYRELEGQFSSRHFAGDPWVHSDVFGRAKFLKNLTSAFKGLKSVPVVGISTASRSSSVSTTAVRKINWAAGQAQKLAYFGDLPADELSKTVQELREGSSKD